MPKDALVKSHDLQRDLGNLKRPISAPVVLLKKKPSLQIEANHQLELARVLARHGFEWQSKQVRDSIFDRLLSDKPKMWKSFMKVLFFAKHFLFWKFWYQSILFN